MRFEVYVRAEASEDDLAELQSRCSLHGIKGDMVTRRHVPAAAIANGARAIYWRSEIFPVENEFPEDALLRVVDSLKKVASDIRLTHDIKFSSEIVGYYSSSDSPGGFYVSASLIKSLASVDADLDIDVVHDLEVKDDSITRDGGDYVVI
ncbi:hypothetical protein [Dyella sp.]|uniref:hypothetical protein n=1 Tax=Dyella sp. TaxID=1869338 RepID=UPI002ED55786